MNGNRIITSAIAIAILLVAASACTREELNAYKGIYFKVRSTGFMGATDTKTAYSGLPSGDHQLISWAKGDAIRVYSPQAYVYGNTEKHETDFSVKSYSNAGLVSTATISPSSDPNSLQWGSGTHAFYAMYPSPTGSATNSFSSGNMVFMMPATQAPLNSSTSAGTIELTPNMAAYAPMLAATTGLNPATNPSVPLEFSPKFTAFEIIINKGEYTTVSLSEFQIKGADGDKLAGTFTMNAGSYTTVASITDGSNVITIDLNGDNEDDEDDLAVLDSTNPNLKLTVFTLPQNFTSGITLQFSGSFNGGETVTRKITLKYAGGSVVPFYPYKKYKISGLSFPNLVDATIEDSISWDFDLQISDSVVWWLAPGIENRMDWTQYDPELLIVRRDVVDWYSSAIVGQEIAWEELGQIKLYNTSGTADDSHMYLLCNQIDRRIVKAISRSGDAYADVSAEWSCIPATGVVSVNKTFGTVQAIAPGEAVVTATVTPNDGSTPWKVSYRVYVNASTDLSFPIFSGGRGEPFKFRGYYMHPGVLFWDGSAFSITSGEDPLELLQHYYYDAQTTKFDGSFGTEWVNACYFTWNELDNRLGGGAGTTITATVKAKHPGTSTSYQWRIPTLGITSSVGTGEWYTIYDSMPTYGIKVNSLNEGNAYTDNTANLIAVNVNLADAPSKYQGKGLGYIGSHTANTSGAKSYQAGVLLIPDGAYLTCSGIKAVRGDSYSTTADESHNVISYKDLEILTNKGCVFLPASGNKYGGSWYNGGATILYWSASPFTDSSTYGFISNSYTGIFQIGNSDRSQWCPVKLIRN